MRRLRIADAGNVRQNVEPAEPGHTSRDQRGRSALDRDIGQMRGPAFRIGRQPPERLGIAINRDPKRAFVVEPLRDSWPDPNATPVTIATRSFNLSTSALLCLGSCGAASACLTVAGSQNGPGRIGLNPGIPRIHDGPEPTARKFVILDSAISKYDPERSRLRDTITGRREKDTQRAVENAREGAMNSRSARSIDIDLRHPARFLTRAADVQFPIGVA
jgi:hypothetical protein